MRQTIIVYAKDPDAADARVRADLGDIAAKTPDNQLIYGPNGKWYRDTIVLDEDKIVTMSLTR
jgi:hypothetical protein